MIKKKNYGFKMEDIFGKNLTFLESKSNVADYEFVIVFLKNKMVGTKWLTQYAQKS
jgi:hypothetical protein